MYEVATGERLPRLGFEDVRGLEGVREAAITIAPHPEGPLHNAQVRQSYRMDLQLP